MALAGALVVVLLTPSAQGGMRPGALQRPADVDWPCVQVLVPSLYAGQMWRGPTPGVSPEAGGLEPGLAAFVPELAGRDVPLDGLEPRVGQALEGVPAEARIGQATLLFDEVLRAINSDRGGMIESIRRFARGQQGLADRITAGSREIAAVPQDASAPARLAELQAAQQWERRLYDERQRSLRQLCEQPVALEQRAYAAAQMLAGLLP